MQVRSPLGTKQLGKQEDMTRRTRRLQVMTKKSLIEKMNKKLKLLHQQLNNLASGLHYTLRGDITDSVPRNLLEAFRKIIEPLFKTKEISILRMHMFK